MKIKRLVNNRYLGGEKSEDGAVELHFFLNDKTAGRPNLLVLKFSGYGVHTVQQLAQKSFTHGVRIENAGVYPDIYQGLFVLDENEENYKLAGGLISRNMELRTSFHKERIFFSIRYSSTHFSDLGLIKLPPVPACEFGFELDRKDVKGSALYGEWSPEAKALNAVYHKVIEEHCLSDKVADAALVYDIGEAIGKQDLDRLEQLLSVVPSSSKYFSYDQSSPFCSPLRRICNVINYEEGAKRDFLIEAAELCISRGFHEPISDLGHIKDPGLFRSLVRKVVASKIEVGGAMERDGALQDGLGSIFESLRWLDRDSRDGDSILDRFNFLLEEGMQVTPRHLYHCAQGKYPLEVVDLVFDRLAPNDLIYQRKWSSPLYIAIRDGYEEMASRLIGRGFPVSDFERDEIRQSGSGKLIAELEAYDIRSSLKEDDFECEEPIALRRRALI